MSLFKTNKSFSTYILLFVLCIILIILSFTGAFKVLPVNDVFVTTIGRSVSNFKFSINQINSRFDQNERLTSENIDLNKKLIIQQAELTKLNDFQQELNSLKNLNKVTSFKQNSIETNTIDKISSDKLPSIITIDKGKRDGININKIVVNDTGTLIGFTSMVSEYTSSIKAYYNNNIKISIKGGNTQTAIIIGVQNGKVIAENLGQNPVQIGDQFFTSSIQDLTPEGIYIGKVAEINPQNNKQFFLDTDVLNINKLFVYL